VLSNVELVAENPIPYRTLNANQRRFLFLIGIADCRQIIQQNRNIILPTKASFGGVNQLDSFFPFEPCLLNQTSKHFTDTYIFWKSNNSIPDDDLPSHPFPPPSYLPEGEELGKEKPDGSETEWVESVHEQRGWKRAGEIDIPREGRECGSSVEDSTSMSFGGELSLEGQDTSQFFVQDGFCDEGSSYVWT